MDLIEIIETCDYCFEKMRKATAQDMDGITWLWPDERWICPLCLKNRVPLLGPMK